MTTSSSVVYAQIDAFGSSKQTTSSITMCYVDAINTKPYDDYCEFE
jgi:hypothetical protein